MKNQAKTSQQRSEEMQAAAKSQYHAHDVLDLDVTPGRHLTRKIIFSQPCLGCC